MTTLTLARLAEIEQAAAKAMKWPAITYDGRLMGNVCDPQTVAALCRIARAAADLIADGEGPFSDLDNALRDAGLIE